MKPGASLPRLAFAVGSLSAGGLALELSLARLLSALYFQPLVYLLLSVAVFGLGLGAALAALAPGLRRLERAPLLCGLGGALAALLAPAALALAGTGGEGLGTLPTLATLALVPLPYALLGAALATLFGARPERSAALYGADLGAAGAVAALSLPLLAGLGAVAGVLAAGLLIALAAPLLAPRPHALLAPGLVALLLAAQLAFGVPAFDYARLGTPKPVGEPLERGARVAAHRWGALARADLVEDAALGTRTLYLDGAAGSLVPDPTRRDRWGLDAGALPYAAAERLGRPVERAFLIGPGGGLDVALARAAGVGEIVAAELSRAGLELVRATDAGAAWYDAAAVRLLVDEGRSALRRQTDPFDLIALSHVVTQAAEVRNFALTENGLYTVEAVGEYLARLAPGGAVAIKLYDELTLTRALATALVALVERGHAPSPAAATRHVFAALDRRSDPPAPLLLVRLEPMGEEEAIAHARAAEALGLALLVVPGLLEPPALAAVAAGEAGVDALDADPALDLAPTRDARPFFFRFERGVPRQLRPLAWGGAITAGLGALALALLAWRAARREGASGARRAALPPLLFAALGAGFLLVETNLLQRSGLLLGAPGTTLATVLGTLLAGGGLGSLLSGRAAPPARRWRRTAVAALAAAALALALALAWPELTGPLRGAPLGRRILGVAALLLPLGLLLGVPFPNALAALPRPARLEPSRAVAAAWAINGAASVLGALAATLLALRWGFPAVAGAGVGCYLVAAACAAGLARGLPGSAQ